MPRVPEILRSRNKLPEYRGWKRNGETGTRNENAVVIVALAGTWVGPSLGVRLGHQVTLTTSSYKYLESLFFSLHPLAPLARGLSSRTCPGSSMLAKESGVQDTGIFQGRGGTQHHRMFKFLRFSFTYEFLLLQRLCNYIQPCVLPR